MSITIPGLTSLRSRVFWNTSTTVIPEIKAHLNAAYYAPDLEAGKERTEEFVKRYERIYPSAVKCFQDDLDACLNHLRCPVRHRKFITSTNSVTDLLRASWKWRRVPISFSEKREILELRYQLGQLPRPEKTSGEQHHVLVLRK